MFDERQELEDFKTKIDLRSYAAAQGYQLDQKGSWRGTAVMRHPVTQDKVIIKRDGDGHFVYFSVRDDQDNGSILDFVMQRQRVTLGLARKELRPWMGLAPTPIQVFEPLPTTAKDRMRVDTAYSRMQDATDGHSYLENERNIPGVLLALDRFAGRIRIDARHNAVFPHFDKDGLAGYEMKNIGFTGFASGGTKALWLSHEYPTDTALVFCESAIDALSHAVLFPDSKTRYASIGGKTNPEQPELIRAAAARMPRDSEVIAAMDADVDGRKLAEVVRDAVALTGRHDLRFTVQEPVGFKDWNHQLQKRPYPLLPYRPPEVPSVA